MKSYFEALATWRPCFACYNHRMAKAKQAKNKPKATKKKRSVDSSAKKSESASQVVELEPMKTKKGEPSDNLHRRAEWFQKRRSGY
jgi:hypothetical protein